MDTEEGKLQMKRCPWWIIDDTKDGGGEKRVSGVVHQSEG